MQPSKPDFVDDAPIRWLAVAAAIAAISVVGIAIGLGVPLLSILLESRGHSATMIGLNTAVAGLASVVAAPCTTPLAIRFGVAQTMLVMVLLAAVAFLSFYVVPSFWMWFPLRAILHFAITVLFILSEFWISSSAPPRRRGMILGIYATVLSAGFAAGPWLLSQLGSAGVLPFAVTFGIIMTAGLPIAAAIRQSPVIERTETRGDFLRYIWIVPMATGAVLVFGAVETGGLAMFPVYGTRIGYSEADAALLLTAIGLGNVLLQIPLGMWSDRMRDRRHLLVLCSIVGLSGMIALPFVAFDWHLTAGVLFVWGGFIAGLYTIGLAHLGARLSGRDLASANAAFVLCYGIGMLLGPQAIGVGMDVFGSNGFAYAVMVFFVLYLGLAAFRLSPSR